ncbi:MAG: diaminopimelate decarboxylase [Flavobacteriales bacterium]|nr:diaminopimelate decarboxylase [Flavobacteriales bacterium]MCB9447831.1 diaminopimelate decarboxylase [Flavobacteriales bacterium]
MALQLDIKRIKGLQTPLYYYDLGVLHQTLTDLQKNAEPHGYHVHYALKANSNPEILHMVRQFGLGADCVSGNEVKRALECGFAPESIVFAGVGKSDEEIILALDADIFCFNCESRQEIRVIDELAAQRGKQARIALRINPNVNANTHKYITTGLEENKFGINVWELDKTLETLKKSSNIQLVGLHFHIGSQILDLEAFKGLCTRVNEIQQWFYGHHIIVDHINLGGGLGVDYHHPDEHAIPDFKAYFDIFQKFLEPRPKQKIHFELGRAIVAQCGSLISKVLYVKKGVKTNFAILDAGMTELIRPALYQSYHKIESLTPRKGEGEEKYDVVGPICESSDCFGKAVELPVVKRGDLIAIRTTGAYSEVMASFYNLRTKAPAVYAEVSVIS